MVTAAMREEANYMRIAARDYCFYDKVHDLLLREALVFERCSEDGVGFA